MIPVLETPKGQLIYESEMLRHFASNLAGPGQGLPLWPHELAPGDLDATVATELKRLEMLKFDGFTKFFWPCMMSKFTDEEKLA